MLDGTLIFVIIIIFIALIFDFGNGMNDAANAISTVVATKVLSLRAAVIMSAFFNFIGAFVFGVAVASTIGKGIVDPKIIDPYLILSALIGAIVWTYVTTYKGLPISVSHALIGGLVGAALVKAGTSGLILNGISKVVLFIFMAPIVGFIGAFIFSLIIFRIFRKSKNKKVDSLFRWLQIGSAAAYSMSHGTNDAQKTMGIISVLLFTTGYLGATFHVPFWVVIISHTAIALGTLVGGIKVVRTMGHKITKLRPVDGFCAETSGAMVITTATHFGIPVSTTHVISGSIMGVGTTKRASAVKWGTANKILWSWILTIPVSAAVSALVYTIVYILV